MITYSLFLMLLVPIIILVFVIGIIFLQVFLSKKSNKWLGLILPFICLLFSIIVVVGIGSYTTLTSTQTVKEYDESGNVVSSQIVAKDLAEDSSVGTNILNGTLVFIIYNIPTVVLIGIYYASRERQRIEGAINKMKIKDL